MFTAKKIYNSQKTNVHQLEDGLTNCGVFINGILLSHTKKQITDRENNIDASQKHHIEWQKSHTQRICTGRIHLLETLEQAKLIYVNRRQKLFAFGVVKVGQLLTEKGQEGRPGWWICPRSWSRSWLHRCPIVQTHRTKQTLKSCVFYCT